MNKRSKIQVQVDDSRRLILPVEVSTRYGFQPGMLIDLEEGNNGLHFSLPVTHLVRVYIEPTSVCNLACRMCARNAFDEHQGHMEASVYEHIMDGIRELPYPPEVFFGGFGEPLSHPGIVEMVAQAKAVAKSVELITNGTLLNKEISNQLVKAGLDVLWISLDGVTPESYADVRLGAMLPGVLKNIEDFRHARWNIDGPRPEIGIAFVAMQRNIADLPKLLFWSNRLGASRYIVTNILPYTEDMCGEVLYRRVLQEIPSDPSKWSPSVNLPRMDLDRTTQEPMFRVLRNQTNLRINGDNFSTTNDRCPFTYRGGSTAIRWDGGLSPCLPLMHDHSSYLEHNWKRFSRRYVIGNVAEQSITQLWNKPEYIAFRRRVQQFDFAPCTVCGGCDLGEANEEDCIGNTFPTCGGCLWAQGVIQCP